MSPAPERATMNGKPVHFRNAKTVLNMDSGFRHKLLCDGPTFSAGDACAYSCSFCYVESMTDKLLRHPSSDIKHLPHTDIVVRRTNAVEILRKQLLALPEAVRASNLTLYMSHSVDVAANMDLVHETVAACIAILELTWWDIRMLSKSNLLPKVAKLLLDSPVNDDVKSRLIFGVSTGTLDDDLAAAFEQGCPKVSKRIQSLHWLQDEGFRTFGMICPSLPHRGNYEDWSAEILAAIRVQHCEQVWAEVLNVRGRSMLRTCKALHDAGYEWQAKELERVSTDKEAWESYSRQTFNGHAYVMDIKAEIPVQHRPVLRDVQDQPKLRFLQYVTKGTAQWWHARRRSGAIPLGAAALPVS